MSLVRPRILGALLGLSWFALQGGLSTVHPGRVTWLLRGDWATHFLGFASFRQTGWRWPIGAVEPLAFPVGTTLGYTDATPWPSVVFGVLSPLLPDDFQFTGLWLAACFALQGYFAIRILEELGASVPVRLAGAVLLCTSPPLLARVGHPSLCAHWLVLAAYWLNLSPTPSAAGARRLATQATVVDVLAAGTHPYLLAMALPLHFALVVRLARERVLSRRAVAVALAAAAALPALVLLALGYFGTADPGTYGFGFYSADLLTLVNPMSWSRLLPQLPQGAGQYEGFGYLGLGGLAAVATIPLGAWPWRESPLGRLLPALLVALSLAFFALSGTITWGGRTVVDLSALYRPFAALTDALRSSGRFVWPLHYGLIVAGLVAVARLSTRRPLAAAASAVALAAIQLADLVPVRIDAPAQPGIAKLADDLSVARGDYRHLVLYPPQLYGSTRHRCTGEGYDPYRWVPFAYAAYRLGMTTNSAFLSRLDGAAVERYCRRLSEDVAAARFDEQTLYVVGERYLPELRASPALRCGRLAGYVLCVARARRTRLLETLEARPPA